MKAQFLILYVGNCITRLRHRRSQLFLDHGAAIPAPEPGLGYLSITSARFDQPIQVGFAPAVTVDAVKPQRVALTAQIRKSYQAGHT